MENPTLEDYQRLSISSVYLTMIVRKVPKGMIPPMVICPVVRFNNGFVRLDSGEYIDSRRFFLTSTKCISDYYLEGQYRFCMKGERVSLEFDNLEPYNRYIEFAGKNFDRYVNYIIHHKIPK